VQIVNVLRVAQTLGLSDRLLWLIGTEDPQLVNMVPASTYFHTAVIFN
jgi:hypothetical protein